MRQFAAWFLAVGLVRVAPLPAQDLSSLPWRAIGPASFGGRIDDIEAVPGRPGTIFVGTAGGGVFRSTNNGTTWSPVFDRDGRSASIGGARSSPRPSRLAGRPVGAGAATAGLVRQPLRRRLRWPEVRVPRPRWLDAGVVDGPTVAQRRALDRLAAKLRTDLTALNALLAGAFAELQRRAAGTAATLPPVTVA
jgi:hypothetical protein